MRKIVWSKKRSIIAIVICAILAVASFGFWQMNNSAQAAIVNPTPPSGLVGGWSFDEGSGTIASDSSGNGNTGNIYGASWVAGKYGQALSFDGTLKYVRVPDASNLSPTTALTVMAWIKAGTLTGGTCTIVSKGNTGDGNGVRSYELYAGNDGRIRVFLNGGAGYAASAVNDLTQWTLVAFTYDQSNIRMYINGVASGSAVSYSSALSVSTSSLCIGSIQYLGWVPAFNGAIDEVRVYNRALSSTEIQTEFQSNPGFASQLTAKIPKGTTQMITTLTWQGPGSITATITSPSHSYIEDEMQAYQKTTYSTTSGTSDMLNIKRLSISVTALPVDQSWTIALTFDSVTAYQIAVEVQK